MSLTFKEPLAAPAASALSDTAPKRPSGLPVDETRFLGAGLSFKGKLIGAEDVLESRGEKMCHVSMAKLKAVVLAIKEHKRPINVGVSLEGVKISDEKTEEILHTHSVSRISFIFRDTTDARAFGYVYSREDGTHQFFGIKTDKPAENVVTSLRDLFEVVYYRNKHAAETKSAPVVPRIKTDDMTEISLDATTPGEAAKPIEKTIPETKIIPPSDELLNFGNSNQTLVASTPTNAWPILAYGQDASNATNVQRGLLSAASGGGLMPPQQSLFSPPVGQMNTPHQYMPQQQISMQQSQQIAWQHQQQQSMSNYSGQTVASTTGFVSPATGAWSPPATVGAAPQGQSQGQTNGWPSFDSSLPGDPFQHSIFPTSSTPAPSVPRAVVLAPNNLSGTFDVSTSSRSSTTNQTWGVFSEISSTSESGPLGASATINEAFSDSTMSLLQPMSAVKVQQGPPPKADPFADFGVLVAGGVSQGGIGKKASKEDFAKEGPKPTLFDLSQSQSQPASTNPFLLPNSNSFSAIAADDPFA